MTDVVVTEHRRPELTVYGGVAGNVLNEVINTQVLALGVRSDPFNVDTRMIRVQSRGAGFYFRIGDDTVDASVGDVGNVWVPADGFVDIMILPEQTHLSTAIIAAPVAELIFNFDASEDTSITDTAGVVDSWMNLGVAMGSITQVVAGEKPTTDDNSMNTKNVIDFDGNDHLASTSFGYSNDALTAFVVVRIDSVSGSQIIFTTEGALSSFSQDAITLVGDKIRIQTRDGGGGTIFAESPSLFQGVHLITAEWDSGTVRGWVNGDQAGWTSGAGGASDTATAFAIGANTAGSTPFLGAVAEFIMYNSLLSVSNREAIQDTLRAKWFAFNIYDLTLWFDGMDSNYIVDTAGDVDQWLDKSGNNQHSGQLTAAKRPDLVSSAINTFQAIEWDGVDDSLAISGFRNRGVDLTVFIVFETTVDQVGGSEFQLINTATLGGGGFVVVEIDDNNTLRGRSFTGTTSKGIVNTSITKETPYIVTYQYDSSGADEAELWLNNISKGTASGLTDLSLNTATASVGSHTVVGGFHEGYIGEVVLFNRALTVGERSAVYSTLAGKWGI